MPKRIQIKTSKNEGSVHQFLNAIEDPDLRRDCNSLLKIFKKTTGLTPKMWGQSIVGFGEYTYYRANGDEGRFMATGFSPRKSGPTVYIMPGYKDYGSLLAKLGPHKLGKSCLYLKNLEGVDPGVLSELISMGMRDLIEDHETDY